MEGLGWKFWLGLVGVAFAIGIGGVLIFTLIGVVWYSWGLFGALLFFGLLLLGVGWVYDHGQQRRYGA